MSTEAKAENEQERHKISAQQAEKTGAFVRPATKFHDLITADASSAFPAEKGRYRLYVSYACPWAHRTLIVRALKGLEDVIGVTVTHWHLRNLSGDPEDYVGWHFDDDISKDPQGFKNVAEIYEKASPGYRNESAMTGGGDRKRPYYSVPILWDEKTQKIVNNESSIIIKMLNSEFNEFAKYPEVDLAPENVQAAMSKVDDWVYPNINDGVYRCGFATKQEAYEIAFDNLFAHLDKAEDLLSKQRYLTGNTLTLSDVRLFTTLVRFDPVYVQHFKANRNMLKDMPNLWNYVLDIYQQPGIADTVNLHHIKNHYMQSHPSINPKGIVCKGPSIDYSAKHDRDRF